MLWSHMSHRVYYQIWLPVRNEAYTSVLEAPGFAVLKNLGSLDCKSLIIHLLEQFSKLDNYSGSMKATSSLSTIHHFRSSPYSGKDKCFNLAFILAIWLPSSAFSWSVWWLTVKQKDTITLIVLNVLCHPQEKYIRNEQLTQALNCSCISEWIRAKYWGIYNEINSRSSPHSWISFVLCWSWVFLLI